MAFDLFNKGKLSEMEKELEKKQERIDELVDLCEEKDEYFTEMISDGLRHGSSLAAKHKIEISI